MAFVQTVSAASAALALLFAPACRHTRSEESAPEAMIRQGSRILVPEGSPLRAKLKVQPAEARMVEATFSAPATVEADPADLVRLAPPLAGRIQKIHVRQGDAVRKGQPLVTLESAELAQAQADFTRARALALQARKALERVRELARHDVASRRELEQAEAEGAAAEAELRRAEARLAQLGVRPGEASGGLLTLRAPLSGKICELAAAHGGFWNDLNAPLLVLANLDRVYLVASVQEKDIPKLYAGQEATASLASFPGEAFRARVASTGELLDPETRTVKIRMPLENRGHRLLPAMFATATFRIRPHKGILVPTPAVLQGTEGSKVLVEVAPWTFEERRVRPGAQIAEATEILEGLKGGERIVVQEGVLLHAH